MPTIEPAAAGPERPRVMVTGMGVVTPLGIGVNAFWPALLAGRSGIRPIQGYDASGDPVQIAGEIPDFRAADHMDPRAARRMDRFSQLAVAAAREALEDAGLTIGDANRERIGVVFHTGGGGLWTFETNTRALHQRGPRAVGPIVVPLFVPNMCSCNLSIAFGILGPSLTGVEACAAGVMAVIEGVRLIEDGIVDAVIAGATESCLTPSIVRGFAATRALSTRNDDPAGACRPFSLDRDGTVLSEGAAALILESESHAVARGATPIAVAHGGAATSDAFHVTAPDPAGAHIARAMSQAVARSGLPPDAIGLVVAHGTGSHRGDIAETLALHSAFGPNARSLAVPALKSMLGHAIGASGAIGAVAAVLAIRDGRIPPTINLAEPDPACDLDYVPGVARSVNLRGALVNGIAFGGQNATAVFSQLEPIA
jgi:3-oxoacyl-[acyl-carrier-protein] synthase II